MATSTPAPRGREKPPKAMAPSTDPARATTTASITMAAARLHQGARGRSKSSVGRAALRAQSSQSSGFTGPVSSGLLECSRRGTEGGAVPARRLRYQLYITYLLGGLDGDGPAGRAVRAWPAGRARPGAHPGTPGLRR